MKRSAGREAFWWCAIAAMSTAVVLGALWLRPAIATTTLKDFSTHSAALKAWFKLAQPTDLARLKYGISYCCEMAERVKTKFDLQRGPDGEQWFMQCINDDLLMPYCTEHEKKLGEWIRIPEDVIHHEPIQTPKGYVTADGGHGVVGEIERPKVEEEFEQLRMDGVLFVFNHQPVCFWPPDFGG